MTRRINAAGLSHLKLDELPFAVSLAFNPT
jgi:hypothetical protein